MRITYNQGNTGKPHWKRDRAQTPSFLSAKRNKEKGVAPASTVMADDLKDTEGTSGLAVPEDNTEAATLPDVAANIEVSSETSTEAVGESHLADAQPESEEQSAQDTLRDEDMLDGIYCDPPADLDLKVKRGFGRKRSRSGQEPRVAEDVEARRGVIIKDGGKLTVGYVIVLIAVMAAAFFIGFTHSDVMYNILYSHFGGV